MENDTGQEFKTFLFTLTAMKKALFFLILFINSMIMIAQDGIFKTRIYNKEYDVFLQMNLYEEKIKIPGQDVLGEVYGYLRKTTDSRTWIIMGVEIDKDGKKATLEMINDYGSEDLIAELVYNKDGSFTLTQKEGSTIKVAGKNKWIKLPKQLVFVK